MGGTHHFSNSKDGVAKWTSGKGKWSSDGSRGCVVMGGAHPFVNARAVMAKWASEGREVDIGRNEMLCSDMRGAPNFTRGGKEQDHEAV